MDFSVFDTSRIDEYAKQAKEQWGKTPEYQEFEQKSQGRNKEEDQTVIQDFMQLFAEFGQMKASDPASEQVQKQVEKLQNYISGHFYKCSDDILSSLGQMYVKNGEFTVNIDKMGGAGTAEFVSEAIRIYTHK